MQPTLVITVPAPGMIFLNGRFAGEASADAPLFAPVPPFGAVYLEYRPLEPGYASTSRKLVLSGGAPLKDVLPDDLFVILWPDNITEVELSPAREIVETVESFSLDGLPCRIVRGEKSRLELSGLSCPFPTGGSIPRLHRMNGAAALIGAAGEKQYILTLTPDMSRQTGFLQGDRLEFETEGILRTFLFKNDIAGHGTQERWSLNASGLQMLSADPVWQDGAPRLPATPEEAALAAVEAALLERYDEADSYLSPALRSRFSLDTIGEVCSMGLPMKYASPGCRSCIGLLQVESGSCARVMPLYYRAEQTAGRWLLTELEPCYH